MLRKQATKRYQRPSSQCHPDQSDREPDYSNHQRSALWIILTRTIHFLPSEKNYRLTGRQLFLLSAEMLFPALARQLLL